MSKEKNTIFRFKQFSIEQKDCAMKVGTDGVLLGAWAYHTNPKNILDVGAGTGLISLMMAQRFPQANITSIELNDKCANQAKTNFENSPWIERLTLLHQDFFDYQPSQPFDLLVSNPPYHVDQYLSNDISRNTARQSSLEFIEKWLTHGMSMLSSDGHFCLILPNSLQENVENWVKKFDWHLNEIILLKGTPNSEPKRMLIQLSHQKSDTTLRETWVIEQERHHYAEPIKSLVEPFYL